MITFDSVTKKYGKSIVLDNVTFSIQKGEFVSIVGPSGAGKTTLIHALIGADKLTDGEIKVDNFNVTYADSVDLQAYRRKIGTVFQDYKLLPKKTVYENIAFALEVCGYDKKTIQRLVVEAMRKTGLENQRNHYPRQLSGGERQRTAIARAIVHAPEILIADEPTGNLDDDNARQITELLLKLNRDGTTVILATHDKSIVNAMKKRVIKLEQGQIVSDKHEAEYD
jgi:cell division transport system ATP-binding protein